MNGYRFRYSSELYHHGIKGQRWGVRRFQNADGTLTKAGKSRDRETVSRNLGKASSILAKTGLALTVGGKLVSVGTNMASDRARYGNGFLSKHHKVANNVIGYIDWALPGVILLGIGAIAGSAVLKVGQKIVEKSINDTHDHEKEQL